MPTDSFYQENAFWFLVNARANSHAAPVQLCRRLLEPRRLPVDLSGIAGPVRSLSRGFSRRLIELDRVLIQKATANAGPNRFLLTGAMDYGLHDFRVDKTAQEEILCQSKV